MFLPLLKRGAGTTLICVVSTPILRYIIRKVYLKKDTYKKSLVSDVPGQNGGLKKLTSCQTLTGYISDRAYLQIALGFYPTLQNKVPLNKG